VLQEPGDLIVPLEKPDTDLPPPQDEQTKGRLRKGRMSPLVIPSVASSMTTRWPQQQAMPRGRFPQAAAVWPLAVDEASIMRIR
jgi:hypothetical protein